MKVKCYYRKDYFSFLFDIVTTVLLILKGGINMKTTWLQANGSKQSKTACMYGGKKTPSSCMYGGKKRPCMYGGK